MGLRMDVDHRRLMEVLKAAPEELNAVLPGVARRIGERYLGFHRARRLRGPPGVRGSRKGLLSAGRVDVSGTTLNQLRVDVALKGYIARQHEEGATVTARGGKFMPVPFSDIQQSKAKLRRARALLRKSKHIRDARSVGFDLVKGRRLAHGLFQIRRRDGKVFLVEAVPRAGAGRARLRFLFHMERQVRIPARLGFRSLWEEFFPTALQIFHREGVRFALEAARKKARTTGTGSLAGFYRAAA